MFLDNIHLYLADPQTGRLEMRFVCHHCGGEITGEPKWQLRMPIPGRKGSYEFRFWHDNDYCYEQDEEK